MCACLHISASNYN